MSSAITKPPTSECDSSEESGWTKYFEDFLNDHRIDDHKCCSVSFSGVDSDSTLFSCAAHKTLTDDDTTQPQDSCFRKRKKIKTALGVDDALEDTATSPVKGSKVLSNRLGRSSTSQSRLKDETIWSGLKFETSHNELKEETIRIKIKVKLARSGPKVKPTRPRLKDKSTRLRSKVESTLPKLKVKMNQPRPEDKKI
ncbi:hypothetical protein LR48_Vigan05g143500 [Vigna angularis]|uniref:Uncharacterized protein n=1 Tax=Phaseolus angularis TaxID=3914 RepID=A0A0L9ULP0_PHAAN|nr:hypothetical protein LR48_Vigan05g143500 [Vigna angularis]